MPVDWYDEWKYHIIEVIWELELYFEMHNKKSIRTKLKRTKLNMPYRSSSYTMMWVCSLFSFCPKHMIEISCLPLTCGVNITVPLGWVLSSVTVSSCCCGSVICTVRKEGAQENLLPAALNMFNVMIVSMPAGIVLFRNVTLVGNIDLKGVCPMLYTLSFNRSEFDINSDLIQLPFWSNSTFVIWVAFSSFSAQDMIWKSSSVLVVCLDSLIYLSSNPATCWSFLCLSRSLPIWVAWYR